MFKPMIPCLVLSLVSLLQLSCDESVTNNYYQTGSLSDGGKTSYITVTNNPGSVISYGDLSGFQRGTPMKLRVNRNDFDVWEADVTFDAVYREAGERLILCHTAGDFPVGSGDSGSPLLTSDGRIAGVLCYGYYGNSNDFIARAIEDVLGIDSTSTPASSPANVFTSIQPVYIVSGYNAQAAARYTLLGKTMTNNGVLAERPYLTGNKLSHDVVSPVLPGSSIAVYFITGDYVNETAIGSLAYVGNEKMYAFGHSFDQFLAAPTYLAGTKSFIKSLSQSFKMSEPSDQLVGSLVKNDYNGVLIRKSVAPLFATLNTTCLIGGQSAFSYHHEISNTPDFRYDRDLAADLSCYLIYTDLYARGLYQDSAVAACTLQIATDVETRNASFVVRANYVDWRIYEYIVDSVQTSGLSKELKTFNLSVALTF